MRSFLLKILCCYLLCGLFVSATFAQVKFSASLTPSVINKDEYTTLRMVVENGTDIRNINPPSLNDFIVVSGANQETGMSSVNGVVNQYMAVSYILQPRHSGTIKLGKATAAVDGKTYTSSPVQVTVRNATSGGNAGGGGSNANINPFAGLSPYAMAPPRVREEFPDFILKKGESVPEKVSKNMALRLETDKTSCYVGEPVVASYKLYTRLKCQSRITENPSFNGFSVVDLQQPDETDYATGKINGRTFNVFTIRKAQLYPLQDGEIELETATLENRIQFLKAPEAGGSNIDDFINGLGMNPDNLISQTVSLTSKPVRITVKPLPEAGKPASFRGAVGKFSMDASLEKNNFSTDETGNLVINISGEGNIQLLTAPAINWPAELEAFDQKTSENLRLKDVPVNGVKTFEIPFSVPHEGNYTIPPIEFSYFDPATAGYKIVRSAPISFTVEKGLRNPASPPADVIIQKKPGSFAQKMFDNRIWIVAAIALLMLFGLILWFKQNKTPEKQQQPLAEPEPVKLSSIEAHALQAAEDPQNPLAESEECLESEDCYEFYALLSQDLKRFLGQKLGLKAANISARSIGEQLDTAGIDNGLALQTEKLLQDIEWQLYTPFERNDTMQELYRQAQDVVQQMNVRQKTSV